MWVEELKNGKYKFVERYTDPMTGKSKRVAVVMDKNTAKNRKMAALTLSDNLSGLRFGEAAALNTSDVDLKNRKIHVTKTYDNVVDIVTSPKTPCSVRDVYIQDELLTVCRNVLLCYHKVTVVAFSTAFFPGTTKEHINFDCYAKYLRETSERIIGRRITPHTL